MKLPVNDQYFVFGAIPMCANRLQVVGTGITQDISFKQWLVLLIVRDVPAGSSLSSIAAQHGSTHQNVKKLLVGLEQSGYVRLERSQEDKRSYAVYMTEKGTAYMKRISEIGALFVKDVFSGVDDADVSAARRVIGRMLENLDTIKEEGVADEKHRAV